MYRTLYAKYRPKNFKDLIGQDLNSEILKNMSKTKRVGHAYLFHGPKGTGKTSAARIFARAINCLSSINGEPCGHCKSCAEISKSNSQNIVELDAASNNGVDVIRHLKEEIVYGILNSKYKVYIIDEIHMLTTAAFNALLKTLEEPPEKIVFIAATTEFNKIPQTVVSRFQKFNFKKIPIDELEKKLENVAKIEQIKVSQKTLNLISKEADGSMRDAYGLLEKLSFTSATKDEDVIKTLGIVDESKIFKLFEFLKESDIESSLKLKYFLTNAGVSVKILIERMAKHAKNLTLCKFSQLPDIGLEETTIENFRKQSELFDIFKIQTMISLIGDYFLQLKFVENDDNLLDILLFKLCNIKTEQNVTKKVDAVCENVEFTTKNWNMFLEAIKNKSKQLYRLLNSATFFFEKENLNIFLKSKLDYDKINKPQGRIYLAKILSELFDREIGVELKLEDSIELENSDDPLYEIIGLKNQLNEIMDVE